MSISQLRQQIEAAHDCQFVQPDTFIEMLTSHHAWDRCDEPAANLLGLRDATGNRMMIPAESLWEHHDLRKSDTSKTTIV